MVHTGTFVPTLSTYLLHTAWRPQELLLGSMNARQVIRACCLPYHLPSPSITSSVLPIGLLETQRFMLTMLKLLRRDLGSCSLTLMRLHWSLLLGRWMTLALLWPLYRLQSLALLRRALSPSPRSLFCTRLLSLPPGREPLMMTFMPRKLSFAHKIHHFRNRSLSLLATLV